MEIFEYPLLRICGSSINNLNKFVATECYNKVLNVLIKRKELQVLSNKIVAELESLFSKNISSNEKNSLSNIRNRVCKMLVIKRKDELNIIQFEQLVRDISLYNNAINEYRLCSELVEIELDQTFKKFTETFQETILEMKEFSSAILLSSLPLFNDLNKYVLNLKVERKTEISLFKYFLRYVTKTSPYSEFTHTNFNRILCDKFCKILTAVGEKRNLITLNLYLRTVLFELIKRNERFFPKLDVNLNKTITDFNKHSSIYITNLNNVEEAHIFDNSPIICEIFNVFSEKPSMSIELLSEILIENVEVDYSDLLKYLSDLVDKDILVVTNFHFQEEDNWLELIIIELKRLFPFEENMNIVSRELSDIQGFIEDYEKIIDPIEKSKLLDRIINSYCTGIACLIRDDDDAVKQFYKLFKDRFLYDKTIEVTLSDDLPTSFRYLLKNVKKSQFIYEDVKSPYTVSINNRQITSIVDSLDKLNRVNLAYANNFIDVPTALWTAFIKNNADLNQKPFVQMYHDYWQLDKRDESLNGGIDLSGNNCEILDLLVNESLDNDVLHIKSKDFEIRDDLLESSYTVFTQLFLEGIELKAVLNSDIFEGYGRLLGRFFNRRTAKEELVLEEMRNFNLSKNNAEMLVQLSHPSDFNANIHPALLESKLTHKEEKTSITNVYLKDLVVRYNQKTRRLVLCNKVLNREVKFIDVDLQAQEARPTYFRFLIHYFSVLKTEGVQFVVQRIYKLREEANAGKNVSVLPRIVLDNNIILRRKSWKISQDILDQIINQSFTLFFIKLVEISLEYGIDDVVFAQIRYHRNRKPFYVDLKIPITVRILFDFLKSNKEHDLYLMEMQPSSDSLFFNESGDPFVTEHILDWKN
ncbi:lantibiotic dehydratase [Sphingobacterium ginsenosidimutans]|uniref:Lantibiotic dehydratase N-terminal domain-containing protein n=1 Tax=Sphingobacterium ginsenosidimutans TaxID=687845 RepID=A0ABP7ZRJ2_9SPHI